MSVEDIEPDYDVNQPDQTSDLGEDYYWVEDAS
jgi:hypothetical protein